MKTKKNHINRAHYLVEIVTRLIDRLHKIKKKFYQFYEELLQKLFTLIKQQQRQANEIDKYHVGF